VVCHGGGYRPDHALFGLDESAVRVKRHVARRRRK
jgi:hypothetical protein